MNKLSEEDSSSYEHLIKYGWLFKVYDDGTSTYLTKEWIEIANKNGLLGKK